MDKTKLDDNEKKPLILKIFSILGNIFLYGCLALIIASVGASMMGSNRSIRIFGYSPYFIETYSMESVMPAGSVVIAHKQDPGTYQVGDDITFYDVSKQGKVVTHRIIDIEIDDQGTFYVTKGVDNDKPDDETVFEGNVIGKVVIVIPELGIYISYIKENLILVVGTSLGIYCVYKLIRNYGNDEYDEEEQRNER